MLYWQRRRKLALAKRYGNGRKHIDSVDNMDGKAHGPLKPRLLALVERGEAEQEAFIAQLSDAE